MSQRWRVSAEGLRVITARGIYSLPPGTVLDELPDHYEGRLEAFEWDGPPVRKRLDGYQTAVIRPAEDK